MKHSELINFNFDKIQPAIPHENYMAIGMNLNHLTIQGQNAAGQYVARQIEDFANSLPGGYLVSAIISNGFLQITMDCKNLYKALQDFLSKLETGEIDIPEDNNEGAVFQYAEIDRGDFPDPDERMKSNIGEITSSNMKFEAGCSSNQSVWSKLEKEAKMFAMRAKEQRDRLKNRKSGSDQADRNSVIYMECLVAQMEMKAKRLKMIAEKAAKNASQKGGAKN